MTPRGFGAIWRMPSSPRLASLAEVARHALESGEFWFGFKDFLDGFYPAPTPGALTEEPSLLADQLKDGAMYDAYLAATCEHLCQLQRWPVPRWAFQPERSLLEPVFFANTHALRMVLLMDSPGAFRSRNLFVSEDALVRV